MQDHTFYCTFKLVNGDEVMAEVYSENENGHEFFIVSNPIVINEMTMVDHEKKVLATGLSPRKWLQYSSGDDMALIYKTHVISMSELDKFGIDFYQKALVAARMASPIKRKIETEDNTGFIGHVNNYRERLENIFKKSPTSKNES